MENFCSNCHCCGSAQKVQQQLKLVATQCQVSCRGTWQVFRSKSSPPFASRCFASSASPTPCGQRCLRTRLNFGTGSSSAPVCFGLGCGSWSATIRKRHNTCNISKENAWNITRQASASSMRLPCIPQTCNSRPVHSTCCETSGNCCRKAT